MPPGFLPGGTLFKEAALPVQFVFSQIAPVLQSLKSFETNTMPTAEIITIGTEILLGEIVDTNARYIARVLRQHGIDIFRTTSIGDNVTRIAEAIRNALEHSEIVITTGGLGPTIDDPTREAVAHAFGVETEFREELWQQVIDRFARFNRVPTGNNRRQAYVPANAKAIENPVGTAPAFQIEKGGRLVFSLPGVPREMEHLLENAVIPEIARRFKLDSVIFVRIIHTAGAGESQIDEQIGDLEQLTNPTVGLAAHSGEVDVRITAKAANIESAEKLIAPVEAVVRERLRRWVYGIDEDTLASVALAHLEQLGWRIAVVEAGLGGVLLQQFPQQNGLFAGGHYYPVGPENPEDLKKCVKSASEAFSVETVLGISLYPGQRSVIYIALTTPEEEKFLNLPYGGPPKLAAQRAANLGLNALRKLSLEN